MTGRSFYHPSQIAACRATFADMLDSWRKVAVRSEAAARAEAEVRVFNQMVVALDGWFGQRARSHEGSDSNALAEVRLISAGLTGHGGTCPVDPLIEWRPEESVTGLHPGEPIRITEALFAKLCAAYLTEITARFSG